jgi:hypothetical protein
MNIVAEQNSFLRDVARLIEFCDNHGIMITGGELFRTNEQQALYFKEGRSKIKTSSHQKRLAIDINFFIKGELTYEHEDIQPYGEYWKSLNPNNRWGGDWGTFTDSDHFERIITT